MRSTSHDKHSSCCRRNETPFSVPITWLALAEIQAQTGAAKEAVENLRKLLSIPAGETISIARLKIDPVWDPIRNDPGFQQLLSGNEQIGPNK